MRKLQGAYVVSAVALFGTMLVGSAVVQVLAYTATGLLAAGAVVVGIRVHQPRHRLPWALLATAVVLFASVGVVTWLETTVWTGVDWLFMPEDTVLLLGYTVLVVAYWSLARRMSLTRDRGALLDIMLLVVGGSVVVYELVLHPLFRAYEAQPLHQFKLALYPLLDYALLVLLARILLTPGRRPRALFV